MKLYDHPTEKRTKLWSTSCLIYRLNLGKLKASSGAKGAKKIKTTKKYTDKNGKRRFTASKDLKSTQPFDRTNYFKIL